MYLLQLLETLTDPRRKQSQQFQLHYVVFFVVLTILAWWDSYRDVERFIESHFKLLKRKFKLKWLQVPTHVTIRTLLLSLDLAEFEDVFRKHAKYLAERKGIKWDSVAIDGKALRGSYDNSKGAPFIQLLTWFLTQAKLILGHEFIEENKTNEIPKAQKLIKELQLVDAIFTSDALHCQKKRLR